MFSINKNKYVVRYYRYESIKQDGEIKTKMSSSEIVFRGSKDQCVAFNKAKYVEASLAALNMDGLGREVSLSCEGSLDIRIHDYRLTDTYIADSYDIDKYKSWMDK